MVTSWCLKHVEARVHTAWCGSHAPLTQGLHLGFALRATFLFALVHDADLGPVSYEDLTISNHSKLGLNAIFMRYSWMDVCMHVCMYVWMDRWYGWMYVCMYVWMRTYVRMYVCIYYIYIYHDRTWPHHLSPIWVHLNMMYSTSRQSLGKLMINRWIWGYPHLGMGVNRLLMRILRHDKV